MAPLPDVLRLVSFNILEGFRPLPTAVGDRRQLDRQRLDAARAVLLELAPDIVVLNEALFCRAHAGRRIDYGQLFSFSYQAAALYDRAWGNAILSRFPIASFRELRIYNRGGLIAVINTPLGSLTVASYHPHPHRHPANKALDFSQLVADVTGPLIVGGDLNCINPEDATDRPRLIQSFRKFSANAEADVDRFLESGKLVFATLAKFGLRDAIPVAARRFSIPTDLISQEKSSGMRIDHILANEAIEVVRGEVVHSQASNRASDHHPVLLEFRLQTPRPKEEQGKACSQEATGLQPPGGERSRSRHAIAGTPKGRARPPSAGGP
jgi:endonuclease/exonuclease/phosphatase family metal-dependent hydrolase